MGGALIFDKNQIRNRAERKRAWEERERSEVRRKARKYRKPLVVGGIPEDFLRKAYLVEKQSMREIAKTCSCSTHKVAYWITAYSIPVRNQSDAVYEARNKGGNPFLIKEKNIDVKTIAFQYGLGIGLYWATGATAKNSLRVGSTDPKIINAFIRFLCLVCGVEKNSLRFGLQISSDEDVSNAFMFWTNALSVSRTQFQKPIIKAHRLGKRKKTNSHGFVILNFYNSKLRCILADEIKKVSNTH